MPTPVRFPLLPVVLAALLASAAWLCWGAFNARSHWLELDLGSPQPGRAQVYYDRGSGFSEADSTSLPLPVGDSVARVRFPLAAGELRALRFDPCDHDAVVRMASVRIVDGAGRPLLMLARQDFRPTHQIAAIEARGNGWDIRPTPGANDAYAEVTLSEPLRLEVDWPALSRRALEVGIAAAALMAAVLWVFRRSEGPVLGFPARPPLLPERGHWPVIDEIKGVALVLVLIYHTGGMLGAPNVLHGEVGVDVFLIIAGMMLATRSAHLSVGDFFLRRFLRIFPAYWLALAFFVFLSWRIHGVVRDWPTLLLHVVGLHGFAPEDICFDINDSFWFISILVLLYAVFLGVRRRLGDLSFLAGVGGLLTVAACVAYQEAGHQGGLIHLAIRIPGIFIGFGLGQLVSGRACTLRLNGPLAAGIGGMAYLVLGRGIDVGYLVSALGIIAAVVFLHRVLRRVPALAWWPALLGWLGGLSYEIYLLHQPLMRDHTRDIMARYLGIRESSPAQYRTAIALAFGVVLGLAWLLHQASERWFGGRRVRPADAAHSG